MKKMFCIREISVYPAAYPREFHEVLLELQKELRGSKCKVKSDLYFDGNRYQCKFFVSKKGLIFLERHKYGIPM